MCEALPSIFSTLGVGEVKKTEKEEEREKEGGERETEREKRETHRENSVPSLLVYSMFMVPIVFPWKQQRIKTALAIIKCEFCWDIRVNERMHSMLDGDEGRGRGLLTNTQ